MVSDWKQQFEGRQWEVAFKLESLTLQHEQLEAVQRTQAETIQSLSRKLEARSAENAALKTEIRLCLEAVSAMRADNLQLQEAMRTMTGQLAASAETVRRFQGKLSDSSAAQSASTPVATPSQPQSKHTGTGISNYSGNNELSTNCNIENSNLESCKTHTVNQVPTLIAESPLMGAGSLSGQAGRASQQQLPLQHQQQQQQKQQQQQQQQQRRQQQQQKQK
eukprot:TRINITY_DN2882_c0_g5_i1.p1 TRINITY_DN2882_c0_g5~~TRINITY_DN2882_c0_g5_i1.p1  ORF type:complete len:260 (+),score=77.82 TRINITY_DN2882_c0_g5_i1:120-782(+)